VSDDGIRFAFVGEVGSLSRRDARAARLA
jgi:hypothetical protein